MMPSLDEALLCSFRPGADLGLESELVYNEAFATIMSAACLERDHRTSPLYL